MSEEKKATFHFDSKEIHTPQEDHCPDHPEAIPEVGFGLAGGGYGPYTFCPECGRVLSKTEDPT